MLAEGSRLLGLAGLEVVGVVETVGQLDLQVELAERDQRCPHCAGVELRVKDRPVVAVRDLPIGGRRTILWWCKRRLACGDCRRSFTETHPEIPARQRVTCRFRRRLAERVRCGAAHAEVARCEQTTRDQVAGLSGRRPRSCGGAEWLAAGVAG